MNGLAFLTIPNLIVPLGQDVRRHSIALGYHYHAGSGRNPTDSLGNGPEWGMCYLINSTSKHTHTCMYMYIVHVHNLILDSRVNYPEYSILSVLAKEPKAFNFTINTESRRVNQPSLCLFWHTNRSNDYSQ